MGGRPRRLSGRVSQPGRSPRPLGAPKTGRNPCVQARSSHSKAKSLWAPGTDVIRSVVISQLGASGGRPGPILNHADPPADTGVADQAGRDVEPIHRALPRAPTLRKPCVQADLRAGARPPRPLGAPQNRPQSLCSSQIHPVEGKIPLGTGNRRDPSCTADADLGGRRGLAPRVGQAGLAGSGRPRRAPP